MLRAIADDFTGATDLATMLRRSGRRAAVVVDGADVEACRLAMLTAGSDPRSLARDQIVEPTQVWGSPWTHSEGE